MKAFSYFKELRRQYEDAGYKVGLTLQAVPCDWRLSYHKNSLSYKFERVIDSLYEATTNKVMIVAHSMGNLNVVHNLWKMSWLKKQKSIARYIAIAPLFLGAPSATFHPFTMDDDLDINIKFADFRITPEVFKKTMPNFLSDYQLMATKFFKQHRLEPWMESVMQRIEEERSKQELTLGTIMDIFLSWEKICVPGLKNRQQECFSRLFELWDLGKIMGKSVNPDTAEHLFDVYTFFKEARKFYKTFQRHCKFNEMPNLYVQTNILYMNSISTKAGAIIQSDPRSKTLRDEFYIADSFKYEPGDTTVVTKSAIMPGINGLMNLKKSLRTASLSNFLKFARFTTKERMFLTKLMTINTGILSRIDTLESIADVEGLK